eukprot:symbB.v1.2.020001.t1/scaffold1659.1/size107071/3
MQQTARNGLRTGPVTREVGGAWQDRQQSADVTSVSWRCGACSSWDWRLTEQGIYECTCCGGTTFTPTSSTSDGQWVWVPTQEKTVTPGFDFDSKPNEKADVNRSTGPTRGRKPSDPGSENQEAREQAESEAATNDPVVDPDTLQPVGRLSRRQRKAARRDAVPKQRAQNASSVSTTMNPPRDQAHGVSGGARDDPSGRDLQSMRSRNRSDSNEWRDDVLRQLTKKKDDEWNPKKGPSPGVKYRSGQPPAPPQWSYAKDDPRAFSKWMRKLEIWKLQVANYLPNEEAAMLLYTSLRGEAEEELEWVDLKKVNHPNGIDFIVETLKKPLQTREIYLKRRYLFEFEAIQRQPNESIRAFTNRYHRCERTLAAVGIDVTTMYDSESRGARLLDRLRLNLDQQRLILVGSGQSIEFEAIRDAAILQFPDHRPTPYVTHAKEFEWGSKSNDRARHDGSTSSTSSSSSSFQKGHKGKGKGGSGKDGYRKGGPTPRSAYVAEHGEEEDEGNEANGDLETIEEINEEEQEEYASVEEEAEGQQGEQEDADESDLELAAHCLTVTARRLNGLRLGRKFSGGKSLAQRKQESHCAVCGEKGHWKGDPECAMSGKTQSDDVSKCEAWSVLSKKSDEKHADPELVLQLEPDDGRQEGSKARNQELRDLPVTSPTDANQTSYMVEAMETPGHELQVVREVSGGMHDAGCQAEDQEQRVAVASEEPVAGEVPGAMHSRPHPEVGKSTWQVQQVPGLRKEMEVERRSTSMGRPSPAKRALAAAFTVLVHSCVLPRPEVYPGEVHGSVDTTKDPSQSITVEHHEPTFAGAQNAINAYYTHAECAEEGGDSKVEEEGIPTKAGNGGGRGRDVQRELRVYHKENEIYESLFTHADHVRGGCRVDVMEVFANRARVSELAPRLGLSASQPIDKEFDFDLMTSEGRKVLWRAVKKLRPLLILVAWPCTEWCIFNQNMNYSWRPEVLQQKREEQQPLVEMGVSLCEYQREQGLLYLAENPLRSALWNQDPVPRLRDHPDNYEVWCHAGAYGAETQDGHPVQKAHRWLTNSRMISEKLDKKLTSEQKFYTKPIEGDETKRSGEYCPGLSYAILEGLQSEARMRCPGRFQHQGFVTGTDPKAQDFPSRHALGNAEEATRDMPGGKSRVFFVRPREDNEAWSYILDNIEARFQTTSKKPFDLAETDDLYHEIRRLVPWEFTKVQATWTPLTRRFPHDLPFTHRGAALRCTDGEIQLEAEDLVALPYPKQRFNKAIRCAVFFYGMAPDDKEEPQASQADEPIVDASRLPGFNTDIKFVGGPPMTREMRHSIARLHCNLGHPPKAEVVRILAAAGKLDSKILAALDALQCGSCQRLTKATKAPTSSTASVMKYSGSFGEHLQADIIYVRLLDGKAYPVLGMTCMSTNYHEARSVDNRTPEHVLQVMKELWYRPFGLPISIHVDPDGCFLGPNQDWHQNYGIEYAVIPGEEAWKLGKIGRRNALMRTLAERLIDQNGAVRRDELDDILVAVLHSMNSSTYSYGRSPCQAVFGRIPRPVGDLISDGQALTISPQVQREQGALQPEILRAEALSALAQFSASQAVKRALLRKTRTQHDLHALQPGQAVAYWRMSGKTRQHKRGAWNLARFLAWDPDKKSAWLQVGKHSVRIGKTQIRAASGWENWSPSEEDLKTIKDAENNIAQGLWQEELGDQPEEEDEGHIDEDIFSFHPRKVRRTDEFEVQPQLPEAPPELPPNDPIQEQPPYSLEDVPGPPLKLQRTQEQQAHPPSVPQQMEEHYLPIPLEHPQQPTPFALHLPPQSMQIQQQHQQHQQQNINIQVNVDSPTYQNFGPQTFGPLPPTPRSAQRQSPYPAPSTPPQRAVAAARDFGEEQRPAALTAGQDALPPSQTLVAWHINDKFTFCDNKEVEMQPHHWDGSPDYHGLHLPPDFAYKAFLAGNPEEKEQDLQSDDSGSDDERGENIMSRQEQKQLDREIPWREVAALPPMMRQKYVESAIKEYNGWMDWKGIRPLNQAEANQVWENPRMRRRILRSRAAYRDKARGQGPLRAKTRVVLIGCGDPDLRQLTRDSPTPSRLSELIILSAAAAGMNQQFNGDGREWFLWISDAAQAFLQGRQDASERNGPLFMQPPRDPILQEAGAYPAPLYQIEGNCYGLANAPRVWYNKVKEELLKAHFEMHSLDHCFFTHRGKTGDLDAMLIVHVDDFLMCYSSSFNIDIMEKMFKWGSVTRVREGEPGEYRGKEITCMRDQQDKKVLKISQENFVKNLTYGKIKKGRLAGENLLDPDEWKEMRSAAGCLQWLGGQCRPDVAAVASVANKGSETTVQDLKKVHEAIAAVKETPTNGIVFPAVSFGRGSTIVTYTDSSWANAARHASQFGVMILVCPGQVSEKTSPGFVLDWKSGRSPRICRSTLAAEAVAADEGADRSCFINHFLTEIFFRRPAYKGTMKMTMVHAVDAKSLYDSLIAENPSMTEKRSLINVRSVQQILLPNQIHWVPTHLMHADNLTKNDSKLQERMRLWMACPTAQLRDEVSDLNLNATPEELLKSEGDQIPVTVILIDHSVRKAVA